MHRIAGGVRLIVGALLAISGLVWMGQGLGWIPGSFMSGDMTWFWIGLAVVGVSATLLWPSRDRDDDGR